MADFQTNLKEGAYMHGKSINKTYKQVHGKPLDKPARRCMHDKPIDKPTGFDMANLHVYCINLQAGA